MKKQLLAVILLIATPVTAWLSASKSISSSLLRQCGRISSLGSTKDDSVDFSHVEDAIYDLLTTRQSHMEDQHPLELKEMDQTSSLLDSMGELHYDEAYNEWFENCGDECEEVSRRRFAARAANRTIIFHAFSFV